MLFYKDILNAWVLAVMGSVNMRPLNKSCVGF